MNKRVRLPCPEQGPESTLPSFEASEIHFSRHKRQGVCSSSPAWTCLGAPCSFRRVRPRHFGTAFLRLWYHSQGIREPSLSCGRCHRWDVSAAAACPRVRQVMRWCGWSYPVFGECSRMMGDTQHQCGKAFQENQMPYLCSSGSTIARTAPLGFEISHNDEPSPS